MTTRKVIRVRFKRKITDTFTGEIDITEYHDINEQVEYDAYTGSYILATANDVGQWSNVVIFYTPDRYSSLTYGDLAKKNYSSVGISASSGFYTRRFSADFSHSKDVESSGSFVVREVELIDYKQELVLRLPTGDVSYVSRVCSFYDNVPFGSSSYTFTAPNLYANYGFLTFESSAGGSVQGRSVTLGYVAGDKKIIAKYAVRFTVSFNGNGSTSGSMNNLVVLQGSNTRITANNFARSGWIFVGWRINNTGDLYGDNAVADSLSNITGSTVTLYAQWRLPNVYIRNSQTEHGKLYLYKNAVGTAPVASENNGILSYDGSDGRYVIVCEPKKNLYYGKGVGASESSIVYQSEFDAANRNVTSFTLSGSINTTFWYVKKETYKIDFSFYPEGEGSAVIQKLVGGRYPEGTDASEPDEVIGGVGMWLPQPLRFIIRPNEGYKGDTLRVFVGDKQPFEEIAPEEYPIPTPFDLTELRGDALVKIEMSKTRYKMSCSVDSASEQFGEVSVSSEEVEYGDPVTFTAALKEGVDSSCYVFDGWYDADEKVSSDSEYVIESIVGDVSLTAKFAARVAMNLVFDDNREDKTLLIEENGHLIVNDILGADNQFDEFVILGNTVSYEITPGLLGVGNEKWSFNAWYDSSDTAYENPLSYPMSGELAVSESVNITARLVAQLIMSKLKIRVFVNAEQGPGDFIDADIANPYVVSELPVSDDKEEERETVENNAYAFYIFGSREVRFDVVRQTLMIGEREVAFNYFATTTDNTESSILSRSTQYSRLLNRKPSADETIYLIYGNPGKVATRLTYANGDSTSGTLSVGDETNEKSGAYVVSKIEEQGKTLTISAKAKNGWRFVGWYDGSASGRHFSTRSTDTVVVTSERTILADFQKDSSAVYEWEGSSEKKTAVWKSKMYTSGRPFNPTGVRVDVTDERGSSRVVGKLTVEMMSSPDSAPMKESIVELFNMPVDVARRLPMRRPERYLQVEVMNDREVDRIILGTSMMELV